MCVCVCVCVCVCTWVGDWQLTNLKVILLKESPPFDLSPSNREVGEVFIEEVLFSTHAEVMDVLVPVESADVKVKLLLVLLGHEREESVVVGVGPLWTE